MPALETDCVPDKLTTILSMITCENRPVSTSGSIKPRRPRQRIVRVARADSCQPTMASIAPPRTRPTFAGTPPLRRLDDANRLSSKVVVGEA